MLRIGICDDEAGARDALRHMLENLLEADNETKIIYEFSSGDGALGWLRKHAGALDLLFLDIEMHGMDGMQTARHIRDTDDRLLLVFVTGYTDFVFDGYAVSALDYIVKPAREEKLRAVLRRVFAALQRQSPAMFTLRNTSGFYRIPKNQILYFYSDKRQVIAVTATEEYPFYGKLDEISSTIGDDFVRIHQRYLVRAGAVKQVEGHTVIVGNRDLPISRAHRQSAMLALAKTLLRQEE